MLPKLRRHLGLDEVYLLAPGVKPCPAEAEIGAVGALGQTEHPGVEVARRVDVADVDRDVVEPIWSHGVSLPARLCPGQPSPAPTACSAPRPARPASCRTRTAPVTCPRRCCRRTPHWGSPPRRPGAAGPGRIPCRRRNRAGAHRS